MKIKILIIPIILLVFFYSSYGQNKLDSLNNLNQFSDQLSKKYYDTALSLYHVNYDSCLFYCQKSLRNADTNSYEQIAHTYLLSGICNKNTGNYNNSVEDFKLAKKYFKKSNNIQGNAAVNNNLARVYQQIGDFDNALSLYFESLHDFKTIHDTANLAEVYSNIGELYVETGNFNDALKFFNISKKYYEIAGNSLGKGFVLSDLASVYQKQKKYKKAIEFYKASAEIWKKENRKKETGEVYIKLAETYMLSGDYDKAVYFYSIAYDLFEESKYTYGEAQACIGIGDFYVAYHKPQKAINCYNFVLEFLTNDNEYKIKLEVYRKLYDIYKSLNNNELALKFLEKSQTLKDSVFNIEQAKNLSNLKIKYDLKSKDIEISNLLKTSKIKQLEIEKQIAENQKRTILLFFSTLIALVLGVFGVIFFYQYRQKNKLSKELLIMVEEREVLLKELHHRVKNNLQIISSLLNLQKMHTKNISVDEILEISRNRIATMVAIHEKLYKSKNLKSINIAEYIDEISVNLCQNSVKKIELKINVGEIFLEVNKAIPLGLILNELITNSIKHAFDKEDKPQISISSTKTNNFIELYYSDNGKGLPKNFDLSKTETLGMKLILGMTKQIKGKFENLSSDKGVDFKIRFPI